MSGGEPGIEIGLHAVIVAVENDRPLVITVPGQASDGRVLASLPFGPFDPPLHKTLETGLRSWVEEQTALRLGYVEQLYTFGDHGRLRGGTRGAAHFVSVGYLTLVRREGTESGLSWNGWYGHFPWEDWRDGRPEVLDASIFPALRSWLDADGGIKNRRARARLAFGGDPAANADLAWDEERVLERYEIMYEAGLVAEAVQDGLLDAPLVPQPPGEPMLHDHRRILATAMARLRGKLKYRPVVFELLPESFTLTQLQQTVESLSGRRLHKQNFRRLVERAGLVEQVGSATAQTGGRPAAIYRFRRAILNERPAPGLRIGR